MANIRMAGRSLHERISKIPHGFHGPCARRWI